MRPPWAGLKVSFEQFPDTSHPPKLKNYIEICKEKLAQTQPQKIKTP